MTLRARYDGYADWYDDWNKPHVEHNAAAIRELLGPGDGLCLDLGCGSGHYFDVIGATSRTVVGLDYSADQLRIAQRRSRRIVLAPGGRLVFYGVHPCFNGPHVQWLDDGGVRAHPTYRVAGWHEQSPWWGEFVRKRVGMRHHPLADLVNAFVGAGLAIEHMVETGDRQVPTILGIRAKKSDR
jgi:hypothetical protein